LQIYNKIENEPLQNAQDIYPLVSKRMNDIISKATSKDPKERYDSCDSFIRDLKSLKAPKTDPEMEDPLKTQLQKIRIDVKVENQLNAFIIINDKGCLGSELSFYGKPGEKVRIIVEAAKHQRFLQQFILNKDRKINVNLIKQSWF
jgi:serine/threonine protein kinase